MVAAQSERASGAKDVIDDDESTSSGIDRLRKMLDAAEPEVRLQLSATFEQTENDVAERLALYRTA
jgi:hypothetical protein